MTKESKDATELVAIFERTGETALVAAGSIEFLPSLALLIVHHGELPLTSWLMWLIPAALFASGYLPVLRPAAATIQTTAGLVFLVLVCAFPQAYGPGWMPLPFTAFAVAFGAAFTLGVLQALVAIALAAGLNFIAVLEPTDQMILSAADLAGGTVGPIFILIAAPALLGMAYNWRRAARIADANSAEMEAAAASSYRAVQVQSARTSVDRRIHETVLNTLNGITQGRSDQGDLLRVECRRDIEQLELGALPAQEATLGALVSEARKAAGLQTPQVAVHVDGGYLLPQQSASALRDALVEALRNVERHADARAVEIKATKNAGILEVTVSDDGRGLETGDTERFGMRNTIKASLAAIGGEAIVESEPEEGTKVRLRVPIVVAAELQVPVNPVIDILLDTARTRSLLFAPAIFGLVMLPWIAGGLDGAVFAFVLSFVAFLACNLALAVLWDTRWRVPLTLLAIAMAVVIYGFTRQDLEGCSSASSVHWIINSVAGGIGLLLFAGQKHWWHWLILPVITAAGLALALSLPASCEAVPVMSLVVTVVYMSAALFLMTVLFREFDRRRREGLTLWAASVEYQAEIERQITVTSQWSRVSASTVALLTGIAEGRLQADDPITRERAASEEGQLRGNLGMERGSTSMLWHAVLHVVELGAALGVSVDAAVISMPRDTEPVSNAVIDLLAGIVTHAPSRTVSMRIFIDEGCAEVMITAPTSATLQAWSRLGASRVVNRDNQTETLIIEGIEVSMTPAGGKQTLIGIRRIPGALNAS